MSEEEIAKRKEDISKYNIPDKPIVGSEFKSPSSYFEANREVKKEKPKRKRRTTGIKTTKTKKKKKTKKKPK